MREALCIGPLQPYDEVGPDEHRPRTMAGKIILHLIFFERLFHDFCTVGVRNTISG
jgi:hypothetical protein